jgi:SAM-dependent methyltransferase
MHVTSFASAFPTNHHLVLPRVPSLVTAVLNRTSDWLWELRLGIRTGGRREIDYRDAARYQPVPYYVIERVLDRLALGPRDVFADIGSGKGRVVLAAARRPLCAVIGVEIDADLHQIARENLRCLRDARAPVRLEQRDAATFDFTEVTAICFFNPFGATTMSAVLRRLGESLRLYRRPVRIAYLNPVCTHQFFTLPWLELVETWEMSPWSRIKTPVHFYRTRTDRSGADLRRPAEPPPPTPFLTP